MLDKPRQTSEKQASSEIAQSRERFEKEAAQVGLSTVICMSPNAGDAYGDYTNFDTSTAWHFWQMAERDTRERVAQLAREIAKEVGGNFAETHRLNVGLNKFIKQLERIPRGKE